MTSRMRTLLRCSSGKYNTNWTTSLQAGDYHDTAGIKTQNQVLLQTGRKAAPLESFSLRRRQEGGGLYGRI